MYKVLLVLCGCVCLLADAAPAAPGSTVELGSTEDGASDTSDLEGAETAHHGYGGGFGRGGGFGGGFGFRKIGGFGGGGFGHHGCGGYGGHGLGGFGGGGGFIVGGGFIKGGGFYGKK
uniref:Uncharacterized protein n=1 Tax=Anopheles atroparvus TaxID=41427 RepID=A0AAG5D437_ANOAO